MFLKRVLKTEYIESASPEERIRVAEQEIQAVLKYHGCALGLSIIKVEGKVVHQEIVVINAGE